MKLRTFTTPFFPNQLYMMHYHHMTMAGGLLDGQSPVTPLSLSRPFSFSNQPPEDNFHILLVKLFWISSSSFSVRAIKDIKLIPALLPLVNAGFTKSAEIQNVDCYISPNRTFTINSIGEFVFVCLWSNVVLLAFKRSVFPDKCGWEGLC